MKIPKMEKKMDGGERGYTLIEILISLTLFSVGMLAVAAMQISGINGNATAIRHTSASSWSADRIEQFLPLDYTDPSITNGSTTATQRGIVYNISWAVTDDVPINNVKTIAVTVTFSDRGTTKTTTFNYYKADT